MFAWTISTLLVCGSGTLAADIEDAQPDAALLEFLGSLPEESDDWALFVDLISMEPPPGLVEPEMAEAEFLETEND